MRKLISHTNAEYAVQKIAGSYPILVISIGKTARMCRINFNQEINFQFYHRICEKSNFLVVILNQRHISDISARIFIGCKN